MTTWELASEADAQMIRVLIARIGRAGATLPPMPPSLDEGDYSQLTKRDAGRLISQLRETLEEAERNPS